MMGAFVKEKPKLSFSFVPCEASYKKTIYISENEMAPDTEFASTLTLDFLAS